MNRIRTKFKTPRKAVAFIFFPLSIFFMELVIKVFCFKTFLNRGFFYTLIFTLPIGLFLATLCTVFTKRVNRILSIVLLSIVTLIFMVQTVYYSVFNTFTTLYSVTGVGQILQFWQEIILGILHSIIPLILYAVPLVLWIIFGKNIRRTSKRAAVILVLLVILLHLVATIITVNSTSGVITIRHLYVDSFIPNLTVSNFGVLTTLRLDIRHLFAPDIADEIDDILPSDDIPGDNGSPEPSGSGGNIEAPTATPPVEEPTASPSPTPVVYGQNVMEIDFDALIANESDSTLLDMHNYFSSVEPTYKNEYTGMFEGKNLIWLVGEAFSSYAVDKDLTPTLYKLANEGFVFTNFYNPVWGVSTSDGEYVPMTGLIPKSGVWSFAMSGENYMPFGMGNMLKKIGYSTRAYHNHTYTYYKRNISHPNMGYDYKGVGNGLEVKKVWPESDLEMMQVTIPEFINDTPFHTYYMTVSGHLRYTFVGNSMASKNRELVKDLPYSEAVRAYLACNIELDRAMQYLLEQLEQAGIADDTVIVLSGDHYPYGLTYEEQCEIAGHELEQNFELYKSTLIIWSGSMEEPITVDKPCSALDILPTICNLMGLEYDSRLLMGRDILSNSDPLVIFSNRSWITDAAKYNSVTDSLIVNEGASVEDGYARKIQKIVNDKFKYSAKILEKDYYAHVFTD
jgi:lipoteichoic acid synthase